MAKKTAQAAQKAPAGTKAPIPQELQDAAKKAKELKKQTGHFTVLTSPVVPCLPAQTATGIVFSCLGKPVALNQTLGQIFQNDNARAAFCRCVTTSARHAGIANPNVPCSASTTVGQVIQAISC